jgi:hypothetical protein
MAWSKTLAICHGKLRITAEEREMYFWRFIVGGRLNPGHMKTGPHSGNSFANRQFSTEKPQMRLQIGGQNGGQPKHTQIIDTMQ